MGCAWNGAELFNGNGGLLSSQQSIDVILDGVLGNQAGSLSSQGTPEREERSAGQPGRCSLQRRDLVAFQPGCVEQPGGRVVADAGAVLRSASLDNARAASSAPRGRGESVLGSLNNSRRAA